MKLALPHKMAQSLSQKLEKIYCEWTSDYPDIPWMTQELRIPVDAGMTSVVFHCVFTQLAQVPDVELVFRSGVDSKSSEVTLEWQVPEGAPGLLLTLNGVDSRALEALVFRQKRDAICRSAMVCLQQDMVSGEWLVLYNSLERGKALESLIKSRLKDLAPPVAKAVEAYLSSMLNGDFKLAASHFHTISDSAAVKAPLQKLMEIFQLQSNAHGMKRVFKFWTPEEKRGYMQKALDIVEEIRKVTDKVCISGGAILGYQREGQLLAHDDDLDIVVGVTMDQFGGIGPTLDMLAKHLGAAGYVVKGCFFAHLWIETDARTGQTLDVFVAALEEEYASFYPSRRKSMKASDLFPAVFNELEGLVLPMPANIEGYLVGVYGPAWRQPDVGFAHPWDRSEYAGLSGARSHQPMMTRGELIAEQLRKRRAQTALTRTGAHP